MRKLRKRALDKRYLEQLKIVALLNQNLSLQFKEIILQLCDELLYMQFIDNCGITKSTVFDNDNKSSICKTSGNGNGYQCPTLPRQLFISEHEIKNRAKAVEYLNHLTKNLSKYTSWFGGKKVKIGGKIYRTPEHFCRFRQDFLQKMNTVNFFRQDMQVENSVNRKMTEYFDSNSVAHNRHRHKKVQMFYNLLETTRNAKQAIKMLST